MVMKLTSNERAGLRSPVSSARTLPPRAYTESEVFEAEKHRLFYSEWNCVGRIEQFQEVGDYRTVWLLDQPIILVRRETGLAAMSAICPHRQMLVTEGDGQTGSFSCPYHLWKFSLEGKLISAPLAGEHQARDNDCDLPSIRLEQWQGFVFVTLNPDAEPIATRLAGLTPHIEGYDMAAMRIGHSQTFDSPWNWKLLVENFMEAYHHIGPHRESIQPQQPAHLSFSSGDALKGWAVLNMPDDPKRESSSGLPLIPSLKEGQDRQALASVVLPAFCWINTPSVAFWYQIEPSAHDAFTLTIHTLLPRPLLESPDGASVAASVGGIIEAIHLEDVPANAGPWQALKAPLAQAGWLTPLEEAIWLVNQWWLDRMDDECEAHSAN